MIDPMLDVLLHNKPYNIFSVIINLLHNPSNFPLHRKLNSQILCICELGVVPPIDSAFLTTYNDTHIPLDGNSTKNSSIVRVIVLFLVTILLFFEFMFRCFLRPTLFFFFCATQTIYIYNKK
jgi:hypothetical protein